MISKLYCVQYAYIIIYNIVLPKFRLNCILDYMAFKTVPIIGGL